MNSLRVLLTIAIIALIALPNLSEARKKKKIEIIKLLLDGCGRGSSSTSSSSSSESCELDSDSCPDSCEGHGSTPTVTTTQSPITISPIPVCPPNEKWTDCPPACYDDGCIALVYVKECVQGCAGYSKCVCECGYFRNSQGVCVPKANCGKGGFTNTAYEDFCKLGCGPDRRVRSDTNPCLELCPGSPVRCSSEHVLGCYCPPGQCFEWGTDNCVDGPPHTGDSSSASMAKVSVK